MTNRRTHHGFYVTARIGGGSNARTAWLVGPFATLIAASKMVSAARYAACHHMDDPRFQFAAFGTAKLTRSIDQPLPPGSLPLERVVDDVWTSYVITDGLGRSWDDVFGDMDRVEGGWRSR